jgi:hypothetical protein
MATINQLEGKCAGRRCFILGSGSSLDGVCLDLIRSEFILALNWSILQVKDFPSAWWMWWDVRAYREVFPKLKGEVSVLRAILGKRGHEIMRSYRGASRYVSFGLIKRFTPRRTVAETAISVADFLGFSEIVLVGVDGFVPSKGNEPYCCALRDKECHFMDRKDAESWKRSARQFNKDMKRVMGSVRSRVVQTSPLHDGDMFIRESLSSVLSRDLNEKVNAVPYLGL